MDTELTKHLNSKRKRGEFFRLYEELQAEIANDGEEGVDRDIEEALKAARL